MKIVQFIKVALAVLGGSMLAGCATLPSSGPTSLAVTRGASKSTQLPYTIVDITPQIIAAAPRADSPGLTQMGTWATGTQQGRADLIRDGDTLSVAVFEVGVGLFSGQPSVVAVSPTPIAGTQQFVTVVREDGTVNLPYLGSFRAAGIYPEQLAEKLRRRLQGLSENPDVIVNISDSVHNVAYLSGAVVKPGRYRLTAAHEKLLDILALAGGPTDNANNVDIKVMRGLQVAQAPLNQILSESPANLLVMPDDRIEVIVRRPSYTVFGATDKVSQIPMDARSVSLAEAVARASGPSDSRANPRGVYIFRWETKPGDDRLHAVVYHLNMLKPESYFLAQQFAMNDKDVILFSNSPSNISQKLLNMISQFLNPILPALFLTR